MNDLGHLLTETQTERVQLLLARTLHTLPVGLEFIAQRAHLELRTDKFLQIGQLNTVQLVVVLVDAVVALRDIF